MAKATICRVAYKGPDHLLSYPVLPSPSRTKAQILTLAPRLTQSGSSHPFQPHIFPLSSTFTICDLSRPPEHAQYTYVSGPLHVLLHLSRTPSPQRADDAHPLTFSTSLLKGLLCSNDRPSCPLCHHAYPFIFLYSGDDM